MEKKDLSLIWRRRLARFQKANCTVREWCEGEGVGIHQFYYWQRRLQETKKSKTPQVSWCAVELIPEASSKPPSKAGLTIHIGKARIEVAPGFQAQTLREVVAALEWESEESC